MQTYHAIGVVGINPGAQMRLSKEQAAARAHALTAQGKGGFYLVRARIEFKAGETFHLDGELPKHLADLVEPKAKKGGGEGEPPASSSTVQAPGAAGEPDTTA